MQNTLVHVRQPIRLPLDHFRTRPTHPLGPSQSRLRNCVNTSTIPLGTQVLFNRLPLLLDVTGNLFVHSFAAISRENVAATHLVRVSSFASSYASASQAILGRVVYVKLSI